MVAFSKVGFALAFSTLALGHSTFQRLWVNDVAQGINYGIRKPPNNNPVQDVSSTNVRCNVNGGSGSGVATVPVKAGDKLGFEWRNGPLTNGPCGNVIDPQHKGPLIVYMSKVNSAATADGSAGWFKIYQDGLRDNGAIWGVDDLTATGDCIGRFNATIPKAIANGDYLVRAEIIALHSASSTGGAQLYMGCAQVNVSGGSGGSPPTVNFPGAYKASDPGLLINIYSPKPTSYTVPGPSVYA
ncbi:glycoside hydrolase family 61 protein [Botryobasidium botryosum FD-172 SS1]|uniref:AA9 family lytic polysaccharide monooxygenase n=1 Tax=Botryobasidium botryosum (strain FD-172 SS1) TaxID=930990 RepID=A0A067MAJ4_BOTB1|nr:glycoside hydrolase family 61 protein [Botryobasidium botryosum FD-172 SS1]